MSEPLRILLVEDEPAAREELKFLLAEQPGVAVVGEAADGHAALRALRQLEPDLVFLDVQIPGPNGLELARRFRCGRPDLLLVFATAYDEHALEAFELAATDYLLKPFEPERVARAVQRAREAQRLRAAAEAGESERLAVERRRQGHFLPLAEVAWIGMEDGLVCVVARDGQRYGCNETLRDLEQRLDPRRFFRCHREAIVHLGRIRCVQPHVSGTYRLHLDDAADSVLPLARNRVASLRSLIPW